MPTSFTSSSTAPWASDQTTTAWRRETSPGGTSTGVGLSASRARQTHAPRRGEGPPCCHVPGQIDPRGKASGLHRRLDDAWLNSVEHQLCPSEHLELIACTDIAPAEVDEPVAALALHGGAAEVEDSLLSNDRDVDLPARLGLICSDQLSWVAPDLNPDVNVLHRGTVGTTEHATRRVDSGDHQSHTTNDARSTPTRSDGSHGGWELPGPNQHLQDVHEVEVASAGSAARHDVSVAMPDWPSVAVDYDGVHLSWAGMLTAEGKVIAVPQRGRSSRCGPRAPHRSSP